VQKAKAASVKSTSEEEVFQHFATLRAKADAMRCGSLQKHSPDQEILGLADVVPS
jgi:hypothetical protein